MGDYGVFMGLSVGYGVVVGFLWGRHLVMGSLWGSHILPSSPPDIAVPANLRCGIQDGPAPLLDDSAHTPPSPAHTH